jgi:hypothetical protein
MNVMVTASQESAASMEQLAMERYTMKEQATMEAAEYIGQHITVNGQYLSDLVMDIAAQMAAEYPEEDFVIEEASAVTLFGLDRIKVDGTTVSEIPDVQFNFNEEYVMQWVSEIEAEYTALGDEQYASIMQLGEELQASLMNAAARDQDMAGRAFELDSRLMNESLAWVFDTLTIEGVSAADLWPEQRAASIADSLEFVRESYEMFGLFPEATEAELENRAVVDAFEAERMAEFEEISFVQVQSQSSTNMLPFAMGGAALIAGGLYLFSRKAEAKTNETAFLSQ